MSHSLDRPDATAARNRQGATRIGEWVLFPDLGLLRRDTTEVRLNAKSMHVLLVLLEAGDRGVSRDELLDKVWGASYPSDNVVSRAIADLRSGFGEKAGEQRYIRTLPKYGYQLLAKHGPADTLSARGEYRTIRRPFLWVGGAAATVVVLAILYLRLPETGPKSIDAFIRLPTARPLTAAPGVEHQPRLSNDGNWVVYAALRPGRSDWDLFRVSTVDGVSQPVAVTPNVQEHGPSISPSGDEVAYVRLTDDRSDIVIQSITLGVPEAIVPCTRRFATLVDWSPDGNWLAYTVAQEDDPDQRRRIHAVHRFSHDTKKLTDAVSATGTDFYPRFSPSGDKLAFLRGEPLPDHRSTLWLVDVESGKETRLTDQPTQIGGMAWISASTLSYSLADAGHMKGYWLDLETGVEYPIDRVDLIHADFLPTHGLLVATELRSDQDLLLWRAEGVTEIVARSTSDDHHGRLSPDEAWIALISRRSGFDELWIAETSGDAARQLTRFDGATVRYPDWHPDGQKILFTVQTDAGERLYQVDVVSGAVRTIGSEDAEATTPRWMPNGEHWVYGCQINDVWGICLASSQGVSVIAEHFYRPQPIDGNSLAAVDSAGVLRRIDVATGRPEELWTGLPANGRFGWNLSGEDLIFMTGGDETNVGHVVRRNLESGEETILYSGAMPLADAAISLGNKSGSILFVTYQSSSDDLLIFSDVTIRQ